jgi:hypothetical protein
VTTTFAVGLVAATISRANEPPRAVLLDEVARYDPREEFRSDVAKALFSAGYELKVVPPESVTVRRFQELPADEADLIILRTHSALIVQDQGLTDEVALFTNEPVDLSRYAVAGIGAATQMAEPPPESGIPSAPELAALASVRRVAGDDRQPYYGIGSEFVRDHFHGDFREGAVVILMGCDTLRGQRLSNAFLDRGALAVVGWSDQVSAAHTDAATSALVGEMLTGTPVTEAIQRVMAALGPDPKSGAHLIVDFRDRVAASRSLASR